MMKMYAENLTTNADISAEARCLDSKSKYEDLRVQLDSSKENIKMEAMKRVIHVTRMFKIEHFKR